MSRQIDIWAGPLSDEDREYLLARGRFVDIARNEAQFPREASKDAGDTPEPEKAPEAVSDDDGTPDDGPSLYSEEWFDGATIAMLKPELEKYSLSVTGKRDELADRLYEKLIDEGVITDDDGDDA